MCLIVFSFENPDSSKKSFTSLAPFILLANRDEYYERPTFEMDWWNKHDKILSGKDPLGGGTWLGISEDGRFAAITNHKEITDNKFQPKSRGLLVSDFLKNPDLLARQYLEGIKGEEFHGFNLLLSDTEGVHSFSNRNKKIYSLTKGRHFLANRFLNTPTKKVRKVKDDLKTFLNKPFLHSEAVEFMSQESNSDDLMGLEAESGEEIPFRFIKSEIYGTRSTTILTISSSGLYKVTEQTYLKGGEEGRRKEFEFSP